MMNHFIYLTLAMVKHKGLFRQERYGLSWLRVHGKMVNRGFFSLTK